MSHSIAYVRVVDSESVNSRDVNRQVKVLMICCFDEMESAKIGNVGGSSRRKIFSIFISMLMFPLIRDNTVFALSIHRTKNICNHEHPKAHEVSVKM
jgi:hypothetical protein